MTSFSAAYAIFKGEIAGYRALERSECGILEGFAIGHRFFSEGAIFFLQRRKSATFAPL